MENCAVIDIFCGVGGLTHGFVKEGFTVIAGLDSDPSCKYAYERNNGARFISEKIEDIEFDAIRSLYPDDHTKVLVGCAPCQPYSSYTRKKASPGEKWKLLDSFADLIEAVNPDVVSMENVPDLVKFKDRSIFEAFVARLKEVYHVTHSEIYCPDYGVPQERTRLVLFASKFGAVEFVKPTHTPYRYRSVAAAIGDLPAIAAGEVCQTDPLHRACGLRDINMRRIKASKPGGTWRDWPAELVAGCHTRNTGKSYRSVYGRMKWTAPSPTITTQCYGFGNGRFGHPVQDRAISMREAALLQSFPRSYDFLDPNGKWCFGTLGRHIGNAVPVELGRAIARSIQQHIKEYREQSVSL